LTTLHLCL